MRPVASAARARQLLGMGVIGSRAVSPEEIQQLRKDLKCSAHELARVLGVDANTVLAWEGGELFPTKRYVDQMRELKTKGPDAIPRMPRGRVRVKKGVERLDDPKLWEIVRKLLEHPALFDQVAKLADGYDDPAKPKSAES
jgi:transcriptional regulator with XRE-family HTH domain